MHSELVHSLRLRWRAIRKKRQLERDLEEEIRFHLEMKAARHASYGMDAQEASYAAQRQFGNSTRWKETLRDMWNVNWPETLWEDTRQAVRSLRKSPGSALAAILILGLGIGAATAVFTLVNAAILRPIPFHDPDRLVMLWGNVQRQKVERRGNSYPDYLDWKAQASSFEGMAAGDTGRFVLTGVDEPERILGEYVSAGLLELLGIRPLLGRFYTEAEDKVPNASPLAVIGEGLWKRRFGSDPNILGKTITLNSRQWTIIGVLPAEFRGISDSAEVWAPFMMSGTEFQERGSRGFPAIARLKPGVSREHAQLEMDGVSKRLEAAYPATNEKRAVEVAPLVAETTGPLQTPLLVLLTAVGLVLLIACANVANLMLARAEARQSEFALRVALGAGRMRLFTQQIAEGLVLALAGAIAGAALAAALVRLLIATSPISLPTFVKPDLDWRVALFACVVPIATGLLAALAPALRSTQQDPNDALKDSSLRGGDTRSRHRLRSALVISEVALATALLAGAGLLMRSFGHLSALDPGYDATNVLTMYLTLPRIDPTAVDASDGRSAVTGQVILERIRQIPEVASAALAGYAPLSGGGNAMFYTAEGQPVTDVRSLPRALVITVSPGFFETLRTPVIAGRAFTEQDVRQQRETRRVIVSENLVRRFWPNQDPIGKRIKPGRADSTQPWMEIIGVVRDMKYHGLPNNPTQDPDVFLPFSPQQRQMALMIRTRGDAGTLTSAVRTAIREIDASVPVYNVATLRERIRTANERSRFASWMMAVFAGLAMLLTAVGVYALMSWSVRRRTREIGIRMAIGAAHGEVLGLVMRGGLKLIGTGLIIGTAAAMAGTGLLETLLFGVSPRDGWTLGGVVVLLLAVGALACYVPARRAATMNPVNALRHD